MVNKTRKFLIIILAHYLFFPFYLQVTSNAVQQLLIFGFLALYAFLNFNQVAAMFNSIQKNKIPLFIAMVLYTMIVVLTFFIPLVYQTYDFSYFSQYLRYFIYLFSYIVLLSMIRTYFDTKDLKEKTMEIFSLATRNYVIFTIVLVIIPNLKTVWLNIIKEAPNRLELLENSSYFARIGWAGYSGFSVTFLCTLSVLFSVYLILNSLKREHKIHASHVISMLFSLIGNSFYGRSGLLTSLLLISLGILYVVIVNKKIYYAIYLTVGILVVFIFLTILQQYNETLASWYNWMMQPITSLITTGSIETSSTDVLWTMWFIPDFPTLLLGNGFYSSPTSGGYYMGTDVGFLRPVLFSGLPFLLTTYLIPLILTFKMGEGSKLNKLFVLMLVSTLFIFEIKAEVVIMLIPIIIVLYIAEYTSKPINRKEELLTIYTAESKLSLFNYGRKENF
ncbi:hypothetical protein [Marinilactibacillus piezotolerans]|uniref:hypothetical protein n=1 Tax=Marinilactibacillus piezotolerans TaxID=258723 RepID=UPI0009AF2547|nr:hypothetical protein [Marinilactibacillus piezotolerans]